MEVGGGDTFFLLVNIECCDMGIGRVGVAECVKVANGGEVGG